MTLVTRTNERLIVDRRKPSFGLINDNGNIPPALFSLSFGAKNCTVLPEEIADEN